MGERGVSSPGSIGGYDVLGQVGEGHLLQASDPRSGTVVALRRLPDGEPDEVRESRLVLLADLDDPHVVRVHETVAADATSWLVTDWVEGATLAEVLASGASLVVGQRLGVLRGMLTGLAAAHGRGLVHGRISPSNVLLGTDGRTRLIDFGIGEPAPAYLAPEAVDVPVAKLLPTSDVYAAAALLVHLLTGRPVSDQSRDLRAVDATLRPVLLSALTTDPRDRPRDAAALLAALGKAAKRAYGKTWWTEAGIGALVAPAVAEVLEFERPPAPPAPEPRRPRRALRVPRGVIAAVVGLLTVGAVVAGAAAVMVLGEDVPPDPVSLRTDLFCEDFSPAAESVVGAAARPRFSSSGSSGTATGSGRASVSCSWSVQDPPKAVTVAVGAAPEDEASVTRLAAVFDGAAQRYLTTLEATWRPEYVTECRELDRQGYDTAIACFSPAIALPGEPLRPGTGVVQFAVAVRDQSLACGGTESVTSAADRASYEELVDAVGELCADVLPGVRRGG